MNPTPPCNFFHFPGLRLCCWIHCWCTLKSELVRRRGCGWSQHLQRETPEGRIAEDTKKKTWDWLSKNRRIQWTKGTHTHTQRYIENYTNIQICLLSLYILQIHNIMLHPFSTFSCVLFPDALWLLVAPSDIHLCQVPGDLFHQTTCGCCQRASAAAMGRMGYGWVRWGWWESTVLTDPTDGDTGGSNSQFIRPS